MAKNQKSYTPEFKQQIVELYNAGGTSYPQLEHEYGVSKSTLSTWVKQLSPIKISEEQTCHCDVLLLCADVGKMIEIIGI